MKKFVFVVNCFDVNAFTYFCTPLSTVSFFWHKFDMMLFQSECCAFDVHMGVYYIVFAVYTVHSLL